MKCPEVDISVLEKLSPYLVFSGVFVLAFLFAFGLVVVIQKYQGGTIEGGFRRAQNFAVYTVSSLQVVVQVMNPATPYISDYLRQVLEILITYATFDIRAVSIPPSCSGGNVFLIENIAMIMLIVSSILGYCFLRSTWHFGFAQESCVSALIVFYAVGLAICIQTLSCRPLPDGTLVLQSNAHIVCFRGEHATTAIIAVLCTIVYIIRLNSPDVATPLDNAIWAWQCLRT